MKVDRVFLPWWSNHPRVSVWELEGRILATPLGTVSSGGKISIQDAKERDFKLVEEDTDRNMPR